VNTTPIHILAGIFAAGIYPWFSGLSITLIAIFGVFEFWQGEKVGDKGYHDFWEFMVGTFIGAAVILILTLIGVIK